MIPKYSADIDDTYTVVVTVAVHVVLFHDFHMMNIQWYCFFFRTINTDKSVKPIYYMHLILPIKNRYSKKIEDTSPGQF